MPIYEYQCEACGNQFETIQKFTEAPLQDCESCGEPKLRKLISPVAFRLKGSGWYETDFKNKGSSTDASNPTSTDEETKSGKSDASSDSAEKPQSDTSKTSEKSTDTASKKQDKSNTQSTSAS